MKALIIANLVLIGASQAHAGATCKFKLPDVTSETLSASGSTLDEARANASYKCFDLRNELAVRRSGHALADDDTGVAIVNSCVNDIRCS